MAEPVRVLHVDNDADFAGSVAAVLERENDPIEVHSATGIVDGLDHLSETRIDCVISEYDLPDGDGLEFLAAVREDYPELPFIMLTDHDSDAMADEASSAGVTGYLRKQDMEDQLEGLGDRIHRATAPQRAAGRSNETSEWTSTLLRHSSDFLFVLDETGAATYVAPSVERVLGTPPEEITGTGAFHAIHPEDRWKAVEAFVETLENPSEEVTVEVRAVPGDGEVRWLEASARNLLDDPVVEGILVNARDVTDRKRHEQELERQNERLSDLASILSHDLRNPLTVAMGNLQLAREEWDAEELATVSRALERMDELIDGVLAMTRLGETVHDTEEISLSALAEECWANVATGGGGLAVESDRTVEGDIERLKQVVENLFRNAREHAGSDVSVRIGALEDGFYVEDDGPGIPADQQERVFEPGYSTMDGGTGLGLNIAAEIVEAHGWSIAADDGREGGARFEITGLEATG